MIQYLQYQIRFELSGKYHIVRTSDLHKVAELLKPCPKAHRPEGQGPVRQCPQLGEFITNFEGSPHYRDKEEYQIDWDTAPCGTIVGMIRGLSI